jgi:quercetin dioxygenase-like cupin family protein
LNDLLISDAQGLSPRDVHQTHIAYMESLMLQAPQVHCPIRHYFAPGLWAREITIPSGTLVSGATHTTDNLITVSLGRLRVSTEDGPIEVQAGDTLLCHAGSKNLVQTLEDSRWTNFFHNPTNETDIEKLVAMVSDARASELIGEPNNKQLVANQAAAQLER